MVLQARSLLVIGFSSAGWAFSFGLGSQVISHWLKSQNQSDTVIGLNHSFYYFGLAVASCLVPWMTRRLGPVGCAALGMFGAALTLAATSFSDDVVFGYVLRFLNGWAGAMSLVPLETIVSRDSPPDKKTLNFAIYGVSLTIGGAIGISLAPHVYPLGYGLAFCLGSVVPFVAAGVLLMGMRTQNRGQVDRQENVPLGFGGNFLSYGTAWSQGFLEGFTIAFLALFLEARGLSSEAAGTLMGVAMAGVILCQLPVSWLADRWGKTPLLLGCYAIVAINLIAIPWLPEGVWLVIALFSFGAFTGAMYPLGLSLLSDRMPEQGLPRAYAWYLAIECVGSQLGAAATGRARDLWGDASMFAVGLAAVVSVLAIWLGIRMQLFPRPQRKPGTLEDATKAEVRHAGNVTTTLLV